MAVDNRFGGVIWTNHALQRLVERGIKQGDAWVTFSHPQRSRFAATEGAWVYYRDWENWRVEVVAKQNEKKEWVILSVWSSPVGVHFGRVKEGGRLEKLLEYLLGGFRKKSI